MIILAYFLLCLPNIFGFKLEACRLIDLSHIFVSGAQGWPTLEKFNFTTVFAGITKGGYYYESGKLSSADHSGTHMDAPSHFYVDRETSEQIELEQLIGEVCLVDISEKCALNSSYLLRVDDLIENQNNFGLFSESCILLVRTDWSQFWGSPKYYGVDSLEFPGIDPKAAEWLAQNTKIRAVGVDTPSTDRGKSTTYETHQILAQNSIVGFENLKNLEFLPTRGATIVAMPLKIQGASGSLMRVFAYGLNGKDPCFRTYNGVSLLEPSLWCTGFLACLFIYMTCV